MGLSIVGFSEDEVEELCEAASALGGVCQIANGLFPCGFAVSGTAAAIDHVKAAAKEKGAQKVSELKGCNAGFHTDIMKPAATALKQYLFKLLQEEKLRSPEVTV